MLVLLPTSSSKLTTQWHGPYRVDERIGKVNYRITMHNRKKKQAVFHINMLKKWNTITPAAYFTQELEDEQDEIPFWNDVDLRSAQAGQHLCAAQVQDLSQLLQQFSDVFQLLPGQTTVIEHHIETGEALPVRQVPYRVPHAFREQVDRELKDMLEHGIIEHSSSDWASPIVVVPKKDKTVHLCVDYRKLNAVSKSDAYPMPRIDDLIDRVGNANYITTLDLTKGYWQVPVAVKDQPKTAFTTP